MRSISRDLSALKKSNVERWLRKLFSRSVAKLDGARFSLDSPHIPHGVKRAIWRGDYEVEERAIMRRVITQQDRVLEGGAGMGVASMVIAGIVGEQNLLSYEASPNTFEILCKNRELNGVQFGVVNKALSDVTGTVMFDTGSELLSQAVVSENAGAWQHSKVDAVALDDVLADFAPNVIVLDIEGSEYSLLTNSDLPGIEKLIIEIHPGVIGQKRCTEMLSTLFEKGFMIDFENSLKRVYTFLRYVRSPAET